jgi:hypothetical protein
MTTAPTPQPGPIELQQAVFIAAFACAQAASDAVSQAKAKASTDLQLAGALAATAGAAASAARELCEALVTLQGGGPVKKPAGPAPDAYEDPTPPAPPSG